jgi:type VI secretion system protein ImpM
MRCGLFGKLAAKRDFIALYAPRDFLNVWEPWMQGGVSASRDSQGEAWQQAYLTAPIWRFWLGSDICGATVMGAFMSSLDGIGRYYPLTLFACADAGAAIAPPDIDAQDQWFAVGEEFLLSTLDKGVAFEAVTGALDQLATPVQEPTDGPVEGMHLSKHGTLTAPLRGRSFPDVFASLRAANHAGVYAAASFWWTVGGGDYQPLAICSRGMPDPSLFAELLTGRFNPAPE